MGNTGKRPDDRGVVIREMYDTDAYGKTVAYANPGNDGTWFADDDVPAEQPACEIVFTGRQYSAEAGLHYYRARYYVPSLGRLISRDPVGYRSGIHLYEYVRSRPGVLVDPWGLQSTNPTTKPCCICKTSNDCYLEYRGEDPVAQIGTQGNGGYAQQFGKRYYVTVKSKSGKTGGCYILQSARTVYRFVNANDAKVHTPDFYNPAANPDGFRSVVKGNTVTDTTPHDYDGSETYTNDDGNAEINDSPGFFNSHWNDTGDQLSEWTFNADDSVQEVQTVKGTVSMSISLTWGNNPTLNWNVNSSDGKIKDKGTL